MKVFVEPTGHRRRLPLLAGVVGLVLLFLAMIAARAGAAETLLWENYSSNPGTVSLANIDGSGGGPLNISGIAFENPEGMAYDTLTNRLYVANEGGGPNGVITSINLDGSGAGNFALPGVTIDVPTGVTIDPTTRTMYWINFGNTGEAETISYARLDGSAGGTLNTTGATLFNAFRIAVDPVAGRVYWANVPEGGEPSSISFANTNGTGGGNLNIAGATPTESIHGVAVDPAGGRVYWIDPDLNTVSFANLNNTGGGNVNTTGAAFDNPYGLAFDPTLGKFYWANFGNADERPNAIGFGLLVGGGGGITPNTAPLDGPQDPVIIKLPAGTGAPVITRGASPATLSCSTGAWGADFAGSFVYRAPRTFAYQWTLNGAAIPGAATAAYTATGAGAYGCAVTAANQAGATTQSSVAASVTAAKFTLSLKSRKAKAKAGKAGVIKIGLRNGGDLVSAPVRICAKLSKKAKEGLKAPKCTRVAGLAAGASKVAKLRVKTRPTAAGTYKFKVLVKGAAVKPLNASVKVTAK